MPKGGKKSGAKTGRHMVQHATKTDFTLYDYAHCSPIRSPVALSGRMKKGELNAFHVQAKQTCGRSMLAENSLLWFEKDPEDLELSDGDNENPSCFDVDREQNGKVKAIGAAQSNGKAGEQQSNGGGGVIYPVDVWFLIGKYIRPEDVASFSAVCHQSHFVVHSVRFWSGIYRRYYDSGVELPAALWSSTSSSVRVHGLKSRVVRSLFYFYPPFQNRLRCTAPFENDPDCLEGATCVRVWHQQVKQSWHFYLKFEKASRGTGRCPLLPHRRGADRVRAEPDVLYNPEERNTVLQVVSPGFVLLPEVVGQVLIKASVSVGHEMRSHRLKLVFSSTYVHLSKAALTNGTTINLDPVTNIHVLRWWDPKYPCRF